MKLILIKIIKYIMIPFGFIYVLFKRRSNTTILMYHRVNDCISKEICVTYKNFIWQMEYLKRKNYKVISLDEAIRLANQNASDRKGKYIVLTFDDGYEDFYSNVYPILIKYNYPSTVYLVPGYIETDKVFWWDHNLGESKLMNWEQIKELSKSGKVQFGSHSMNHPDFDLINNEALLKELRLSREILEEKLNQKIKHFSYPRGIVTKSSMNCTKDYYDTAVSIFNGYEIHKSRNIDCFTKLKRLPVQRSDGRYLFGARLKGWLKPEEWVKKFLGRN